MRVGIYDVDSKMTNKPIRIQRKRTKGWRMPENTIFVGRPTKWGNPFIVGEHGTQEQCCLQHRLLLSGVVCGTIDLERAVAVGIIVLWNEVQQVACYKHIQANIESLRGKNLSCWCPLDQPCHADLLLKLANKDK